MANLEHELLAFGLSEREAQVYLALTQLGRMQATMLARRIGIPRTSVYPALGALAKRGLVSEHIEAGVTFFSANSPQALLSEIEREKHIIAERENRARALMTQLNSLSRKSDYSVPMLQYFDGSANVENMLHRFLDEWMVSMQQTGDILWGYQDHTFVQHYQEWLKLYWKTKSVAHQIRLFSNESEEEKTLKNRIKGREIRVLPGGLELRNTLWVSGDYVTVIMTRQQPHYAFQVQDFIFAESLRQIFQGLWSVT